MMIYALINPKGGSAKSTMVTLLTFSKVFRKKYKRIGIVELDEQETIGDWIEQRKANDLGLDDILYKKLTTQDEKKFQEEFAAICEDTDAVIIDCPGESIPKFATKFSINVADVILVPFKPTELEEQSFIKNLYPAIVETQGTGEPKNVVVIPTRIQGQTKRENVADYFSSILPEDIKCIGSYIPFHDIFGDFSREGMNLRNYGLQFRKNKRMNDKVKKMIELVEEVTKDIIKIGEAHVK